jgi:hypothetical protein
MPCGPRSTSRSGRLSGRPPAWLAGLRIRNGKHNVDCSCAIPLLSTPTGCHACCPWGTAAGTRSHARPAAALGLKIQSCRPRRPGGRVLCAPRSRRAHNRCSRRVQLVRKRSKGQSPHGVMDQTEVACVSTLLSFARAAQRFHRASSIACCRCLLGPDLQFAQLPRGLRCVHSFELPISALSSKPPGCTWRVGDMRRLVSSCLWDLAADLRSGRRRAADPFDPVGRAQCPCGALTLQPQPEGPRPTGSPAWAPS